MEGKISTESKDLSLSENDNSLGLIDFSVKELEKKEFISKVLLKINIIRDKKNISYDSLADLTHIKKATLNRQLNGHSKITLETLYCISKVLDVPIEILTSQTLDDLLTLENFFTKNKKNSL